MTKEYVTLEKLKQQCNIDFDFDDEKIHDLLIPAQLSIEAYLNRPLAEFEDLDGEIDRRIWHAIRILVADWYKHRESQVFARPYDLPHLALLLQPLRKYT